MFIIFIDDFTKVLQERLNRFPEIVAKVVEAHILVQEYVPSIEVDSSFVIFDFYCIAKSLDHSIIFVPIAGNDRSSMDNIIQF